MRHKARKFLRQVPVGVVKFIMNRYRPYRGAGIKTLHIAKDYRYIKVAMPLKWHNRNYFGTHFGGSLFAMTDAFYPLMLSHILGLDYIIWDKESSIKYIAPGKTTVYCEFRLSDEDIDQIKQQTTVNGKIYFQKEIEIYDQNKQTIARVLRIIYIKDKKFIAADNEKPVKN
ncbi:DUF4442 domain-containing protein [Cysteiniphilum sp. QT6929]|uniref:DUF4442 domain-containing protein n=1 Tax=Cysteiniphilum sp. QT6929 TaxID=2975055 RepID=UPI0024B37985|nr:DUF4442 domain-containing protein [Cysteiniphilum sp. QT6929]WHN65195.1 DUF4442 domain-containing protein [Cysteiniphilum sp. QT6929]